MDVFGYNFDTALYSVEQSIDWIISVKDRALIVRYPEIDCNFIRTSFTAQRILNFAYGKSSWLDSLLAAYRYRKAALKKQTDSMSRKEGEVVDLGFSYYDKNTLLHRKHIGNPQRLKSMSFTAEQEEKIRRHLGDKYLKILSFTQNNR